MVAGLDKPPRYWNQSSGEGHTTSRSKLNEEQTRERIKLHAERLAFGTPTIQQIVDHWWNKYQIKLVYTSEKEWAKGNELKIIDKMNQMVEEGTIRLVITDQTLLNTVNVSGVETGKTIKSLEDKFLTLLKRCDFQMDALRELGYKEDEYEALDEATKQKVDKKIARWERINKMRLNMLPELSAMIRDHKKILLDTVSRTKEMYNDSELKKIAIDRAVAKAVEHKTKTTSDERGFNPMDVDISDDDRKVLIGVN